MGQCIVALALFVYMKRVYFIVFTSLFFLLTSCQTDEGKVKSAAQLYLDATGRYDVATACQYCTEETANGLRQIDTTVMRMVDSSYIRNNTPAKIKITDVSIIDDTSADVKYHKRTPISDFDGSIQMRYRDGRWLAHKPVYVPSTFSKSHYECNEDSLPYNQVFEKR